MKLNELDLPVSDKDRISQTVTVYHGTSKAAAERLMSRGWIPGDAAAKSNDEDNHALRATNHMDTAKYHPDGQEKQIVLVIRNVPLDHLEVDPDHGTKKTVEDELHVRNEPGYVLIKKAMYASKFVLPKGQDGEE